MINLILFTIAFIVALYFGTWIVSGVIMTFVYTFSYAIEWSIKGLTYVIRNHREIVRWAYILLVIGLFIGAIYNLM